LYLSSNGTDSTFKNSPANSIKTGIWYFAGGTLNQTDDEINMYINGHVNNDSGTPASFTTDINDSAAAFCVGANHEGGGDYFDGEIAQLIVWNTCLTASKVKQAMEVWRP
jgi:hypothetical protein